MDQDSVVVVPEHNNDPAKLILTAKAKDSPHVKEWYSMARENFKAVVKAFNARSLPGWIYEENQKVLLGKLRELWTQFIAAFPSLGFEGGQDPIAFVGKLVEAGKRFDGPLKHCKLWLNYSNSVKGLQVKIEDYCFDNIYFNMRKAGKLQFPGEPPREQQKMSLYSNAHDPTSPMFGFHPF